jgi:hypothetical protein
MYVSIQTVCSCHGYLLFESIHCDRCRSLIPYQITDESFTESKSSNHSNNGSNTSVALVAKQTAIIPVTYQKQHQQVTTGRVRFRTSCPFCNNSIYVLRYYCKRERLFHDIRLQSNGTNEHNVYRSIVETQDSFDVKTTGGQFSQTATSNNESTDDSYSYSGSIYQQGASTIIYDQRSDQPTSRDRQIEAERRLYTLNNLEGDLFNVLRSGLYYDILILCQDDIKIQAHRCILGRLESFLLINIDVRHSSTCVLIFLAC